MNIFLIFSCVSLVSGWSLTGPEQLKHERAEEMRGSSGARVNQIKTVETNRSSYSCIERLLWLSLKQNLAVMSNICNVDFEEITKFPGSNIKIILFLTVSKY